MALPNVPHTPVAPSQTEANELAELLSALSAGGDARARISLSSAPPENAPIPPSALEVLRRAVAAMARGNAVMLYSVSMQLSTQQAIDVLNVPRHYLNQLLTDGEIPYTHQGTHRRLRFNDVMAYRDRRAEQRRVAYRRLLVADGGRRSSGAETAP